MTPFAWLCLAHLIGDWMLQNDWMARNKSGRPLGAACLVHCLIYTVVLVAAFVALWWFGLPPVPPVAQGGLSFAAAAPLFAVGMFVSHWLIDGWRLAARWGVLMGQTHETLVRFAVDQTLHLTVLAVLTALLLPPLA